jgi:translation initiation factor IF-2
MNINTTSKGSAGSRMTESKETAARERIYTIAQEMGVASALLLKKCQMLGISAKNHMSYVYEADIQALRRAVQEEKKETPKEEILAHGILRRRAVKPPPPPPAPKPAPRTAAAPIEYTAPAVAEAPVAPGPVPEEPVVVGGGAAVEEKAPAPGQPFVPRIIGQIELPHGRSAAQGRPAEEARRAAAVPVEKALAPQAAPGRRFEVVKSEPSPWEPKGKKPRKKKVAPGTKVKKTEITVPKAIKRIIRIEGKIQLQELARSLSIKATELLMKLLQMGMTGININSSLDVDTAKIIASEYAYEVEDVAIDEEGLIQTAAETEEVEELVPRPPIVTVMGHVDHGKTTLLDTIRKTRVAAGEAGGITQRIGASIVQTPKGNIVFIDTPGHEAFTAMRARGAQVTDIVVLIVAANDGVQEQTVESIAHARAAKVPIIVAINKIDLPNANIDMIRKKLAEHNLLPEAWGGDTLFAEISALTGKGIDALMEAILLQAEMLELKTNPKRGAHGLVIESRLDKSKGPTASIIIRNGTLHTGDYVIAGTAHGRIRAMIDSNGVTVNDADVGTPVEILGLNHVPAAGDPVDVLTDVKKAQWIAESRATKAPAEPTLGAAQRTEMMTKMGAEEAARLDLIIKADVHGSMEAIRSAILQLAGEKAQINVIHASVGAITESDVMLASASKAMIVGFTVRTSGKSKAVAEAEKVQIRLHTIIYEMLDDLRAVLKGMVAPEYEEVVIGKAKVLKLFKISKVGNVAGCAVEEGKLTRQASVRLLRDLKVVWTGKISSLRHYKDEAREVAAGQECGVSLDGYQDVKEGDELEVFEMKEKEVVL